MPTFDTPEPISATIGLSVGDLRIVAGHGGSTIVDIRPTDASNAEDVKAAEQTRVEYSSGALLVKSPKLRSWSLRGGGPSVDVTIELPAGSSVNGSLSSVDCHCEGPLGDCRIKTGLGGIWVEQAMTVNLKTGLGDITVERATGDAELTTGSGEVRARLLDRGAVIKNSNGDTWVGAVSGELRINAANGSIAVDLAEANVAAKSANGDVRLGEVVRGSVVLETAIGDLEVGVREGTAAWLDVSARGGKVHSSLEASDAPEPSAETVEVRGRTSVGTITIRRP